jgi:urease accessory protein
MIRLTRKLARGDWDATLTLPLESRVKCRLRVTLDNGDDAGVFLERGDQLREGDLLASENGYRVRIRAAAEEVSTARSDDPLLLARACYHLGNRHVPLQIAPGWVRYQPDHVLDQMLQVLGLEVSTDRAPFDPEPGAYGGRTHGHGHGH